MKSRLLLFLLFAFSFGNAQISVNESFEGGLPSGWTNDSFAANTGGACTGTFAMRKQFSQSSPFGGFSTSNFISNGNAISFSVQYSVQGTGTVAVETSYTVSDNGAAVISNGASAQTTSCQTITFTIPAGTVPAGSQIKFNFGGFRQSLTTNLNYDNLIINQIANPVTPEQIANYPFNNSLNNAAGNSPFFNGTPSFVLDRSSQAQSAIRVGSTSVPSTATIANLPIGAFERTISFWHKKPTHTVPIGLFAYGTSAALQTFGIYLLGNGNYVFQGSVNDVTFASSATAANTWVHTVVTFKNGVVKLYNNGSLVASTNLNLNTGSSAFRLGGIGAIVEFDDLQVYNYELSASQVGELHSNNVLSSSDFSQNNLKVALYPNPVRDILNIELENEIKSIEIYNLQGQKVVSSNQKQVSVAELASGIYMIRIEDENNGVTTKRIVKQ